MSGTPHAIADFIKVTVAAEGKVLGSRLSQELKNRFPDWQAIRFGARNLRQFITDHVPDVVEAGRSGMDVVYALKGAERIPDDASKLLSTAADFWRVWVSPNSPYALAIERDAGTVKVVHRGATVTATQVLVSPLSVTDHRDIAKAFLEDLPDPVQERMRAAVELTGETWWQAWRKELRETQYTAEWYKFRRHHLTTRLSEQLKHYGLAAEIIETVIKRVQESGAASSHRGRRATTGIAREMEMDDVARQLVALAVQRMSVAELRELRLPLGIILDVLTMSKS